MTDPLEQMGAKVTSREGGRLPVTITGAETPLAADHTSKVASAQIKSAVLLAALNARGTSIIREPHASRDHTESMLRHFGASVRQTVQEDDSHHMSSWMAKPCLKLRTSSSRVTRHPPLSQWWPRF